MAKKAFTVESNLDKIIEKVQEKPNKVMNIIGQNLTKEIKQTTLKSMYKTRTNILAKTLGYWARKNEKDLQIGFKMSIEKNKQGSGPGIIGDMITSHHDPIKPVVSRNIPMITKLITTALKEIEKE